MPTQKRERQRAGRQSRREAARIAQQKAARRRQMIAVGSLLVVVVVGGLVISRTGDDGGKSVSAGADEALSYPKGSAGDPTACPPKGGTKERHNSFPEVPKTCIDAKHAYTAEVSTDLGAFTIALDPTKAPKAVNSFVFLARNHFYDGVPFHRVVKDFVIQGGDGEKADGTGGPGYTFEDELPEEGRYKVGSLAMANSGPDTNGSQFFVITGAQGAALQPNYSLFGNVTEGLDVVKKIEADGSEQDGAPLKKTHKITGVEIVEKEV